MGDYIEFSWQTLKEIGQSENLGKIGEKFKI
jgi:hypothetical protein